MQGVFLSPYLLLRVLCEVRGTVTLQVYKWK